MESEQIVIILSDLTSNQELPNFLSEDDGDLLKAFDATSLFPPAMADAK